MHVMKPASNFISSDDNAIKAPKIGGALYWVGLYLILFMLSYISDIISFFIMGFSNTIIVKKLLNYNFLIPLLFFQIFMFLIVLIGYLKKYYYFPSMFMIFLISNFLFNAEYLVPRMNWYSFDDALKAFFGTLLILLLDIVLLIYMFFSHRVKQTFIN